MKTLVLGSEGFIGKPFCNYLKSMGKEVVGLDIKYPGHHDLRYEYLDLEDVEAVYFLAWDVGGAKYLYEEDTQLYQLNWNIKLLSNIMPQLQTARIPFLFSSSQLAGKPDTAYGVTKRLGEVWTSLIGGTYVRLWNVYGTLEEPSKRSHVISDFVYSAVRTGKIEMMTTGEERRQFVYIDDVFRAFHVAMKKKLNGTYDVTNSRWVSIIDVARIIAKETGAEIICGKETRASVHTPVTFQLPHWTPVVSLEEGLKNMIERARNE
jgi:nucleoside-diphosphate-sugar epimerase